MRQDIKVRVTCSRAELAAIHDTEERIAAGMRRLQSLKQNQASVKPESGVTVQGESAEIVAKKIGKNKNDVKAIRAIQEPDKAVPEVAPFLVFVLLHLPPIGRRVVGRVGVGL